jgi:hypothetical protein
VDCGKRCGTFGNWLPALRDSMLSYRSWMPVEVSW